MAVTPRASEIAAVTAVLNSDEFEDDKAMARALVQVVAAELSKRDAFGVAIGLKTDDLRVPHGPFYTQLAAKRVVKHAEARGLVAFIAPLYGSDKALSDDPAATAQRCRCGHPEELHGSAIKPRAVTSLGCAVYARNSKEKCSCTAYQKG